MSSPQASPPASPHVPPHIPHRPGSLRSVASNSSIASGVSLTRRPRTRTRSRTVTGSSAPAETPPRSPASELPYLDKPYVQEPLDADAPEHEPLIPPPRPPRSPQRLDTEVHVNETHSSLTSEQGTAAEAEVTLVASLPRSATPPDKLPKTKITLHASAIDTSYKPPPSAFSRDPALTPVINVRDSLSTQLSGTSSSIYPPSTSTASGPDSPPSPRSLAEQHEDMPPFAEVSDVHEYDNDDVSYRLRLLVKNNYFLPPAHSKPSPSDFASTAVNTQKKPAAPTFLDIFRVGRSKSKPTTPTGTPPGFDSAAPMLRTTSDSITASYALQQPRLSLQTPRMTPNPAGPTTRGRVVVVREKMNDIAVAAKQAEQELKTRGVRLDQGSQKAKQEIFDNVIDPTDAVDLPPPSSTYPFAVQASALHGLGVQDSVGAALLADRLPPPTSPNMSVTWDPEEDSWRKALLHEAVYHSLDNSVDLSSSFSPGAGASTPPPRMSGSTNSSSRVAAASPSTKVMLERRIMEPPLLEALDATPPALSRTKSSHSNKSATTKPRAGTLGTPDTHTRESSHRSSYLPARVDTPTEPMTPLAPPPRRQFINPLFSLSQTSLPNSSQPTAEPRRSASQASSLRRSTSSPMLYDAYERRDMTPPPMPRLTIYSNSSRGDANSHRSGSIPVFTDVHSHYGGEDEDGEDDFEDMHPGRQSLALSAVNGRPSLSEYSQSSMSPTTSAFQEALNSRGGYHSTASSVHNLSRVSVDQQGDGPASRYTAMSPPPRVSSSLAHVTLLPPPRTSSMRYTAVLSRSSASSDPPSRVHEEEEEVEEDTLRIVAPAPSTPPLPISTRRGNPNHVPLSLDIPSTSVPVAIHSAPGPISPTSFFDTIQMHPNAMDDLDSSSDEDSEDEDEDNAEAGMGTEPPLSSRVRAFSATGMAPFPRPPFMRLGNHSTPYVSHSNSPIESIRSVFSGPVSSADPMRPVGNIPVRAPFFTERKSEQGHVNPATTFDFYRYAQEHPPAMGGAAGGGRQRPATADVVAKWQGTQRAQESLRRLDGMLLQHMETEKDTIKRIATTIQQTKHSTRPLTSATQ